MPCASSSTDRARHPWDKPGHDELSVLSGSPADFGNFIAAETEKWAKVIRATNIEPE